MGLTIGVVIPVHNRHELADRALASVLAQSRPPERVVIVDDASTPPIVAAAENGKTSVEVIRQERNGGAAIARQRGIDALDTSHIAFLDSDDYWLPDKLAVQASHIEALGQPEMVGLACGWRYEQPHGALGPPYVPRGSDRLVDFVAGCWFCPGSTALVPRQAIQAVGGFDPVLRRLEDLDLFIRLAAAGLRLEVTRIDGAVIRRGANAKIRPVEAATALLRRKFLARAPHMGGLPDEPAVRRRFEAWLAVEEARAARDEGDWPRMARRLARSFALMPRPRIQLGDWWQH